MFYIISFLSKSVLWFDPVLGENPIQGSVKSCYKTFKFRARALRTNFHLIILKHNFNQFKLWDVAQGKSRKCATPCCLYWVLLAAYTKFIIIIIIRLRYINIINEYVKKQIFVELHLFSVFNSIYPFHSIMYNWHCLLQLIRR